MLEEEIKKFVEEGANLEHDRWVRWQKYMFSKFEKDSNGNLIVPKEYVERWFRQIDTPYVELSEQEKESDRQETRNYLPIIKDILLKKRNEILLEIERRYRAYHPYVLSDQFVNGRFWEAKDICELLNKKIKD